MYDAIRQKLVFQDGAKLLCSRLRRLGYKLAVVSGGFVPLAKYVQGELGLHYAFANTVCEFMNIADSRWRLLRMAAC